MINKGEIEFKGYSIPFLHKKVNPNLPTSVFFSGIFNNIETWQFLLQNQLLNKKVNFLFFLYRGQQGVAKGLENEEIRVEDNAECLNKILEVLNLSDQQVHLVGFSIGNIYLLDYAIKNPQKVKSILLLSPYFLLDYLSREKFNAYIEIGEALSSDNFSKHFDLNYYDLFSDMYKKKLNSIRIMRAYILSQIKEEPENMSGIIKIEKAILEYCKKIDSSYFSQVKKINCNKKIVFGERDRICNQEFLLDICSQINAEYQEIYGAGHLWPIVDERDLIISLMDNYIDINENSSRDRRTGTRKPTKISISTKVDDNKTYCGYILNISEKGFLIQIEANEELFKNVNTLFVYRDDLIQFNYKAHVAWLKQNENLLYIGVEVSEKSM
ncbi:UNVERIFIED_CONTAM: pimeloyl-ACP methyl ester carboxylesterase [Acetivibrio alkalicellulosi]